MPAPELSADEVARALSFLSPEEIMPLRRVNMTWKDAAKKTIVPPTNFIVNSVQRCNALSVMARVLPNLQQITLGRLGYRHKYNDGEDPYEEWAAKTVDWPTHDIEFISNFSKLRDFAICDSGFNKLFSVYRSAQLNGRYPFLFTSFPLLEKLSIEYCDYLKLDLEMLAGLPLLKELVCIRNDHLTGNISSLRVLKGTLEKVDIILCSRVEGNFMDLADFPHLKKLNLGGTAVTGDIREVGENDFSALENLVLPKGVYGGRRYELQRISDAPELVRTLYLLKKKFPALDIKYWYGKLSKDSPDWYESVDEDGDSPPFYVRFVEAGCRVGYIWETEDEDPCEVNWLDPEPESGSSDYEDYVADYQRIQKADFYRGYYDPPTEEEYTLLHEESDED